MSVPTRYASREALTQSLPYAAILQARGLACLLSGASIAFLSRRNKTMVARMQRPRQIDIASLRSIVERTGASDLLIEPAPTGSFVEPDGTRTPWSYVGSDDAAFEAALPQASVATTSAAIAHSKTRVIDLSGGYESVLANMSSVARRNVRGADKDNLHYAARPFRDIDAPLLEALRAVHADFHRARPHLKNDWAFRAQMIRQFADQGDLVTAHAGTTLVGAVLLPRHDRVAHYYAVVTASEAPSNKLGTGLVAQCLRAAIDGGCDLFDFVGVRDERHPKRHGRWDGFSAFKARFGGEDVYLPPNLTLAG